MHKIMTMRISAVLVVLMLASVAFALPKKAKAIETIDKTRYLGKWYEIARLDFYFERGLNNTSAEYALNEKGLIQVINRGFDSKKNKWKEAQGVARFRTDKENGELEVSFFGPFYSEYNVIAVDTNYQYALVVGKNTKYMWILSRETSIPESIKTEYILMAQSIGIDTTQLIWVDHDK